MDSRGDFLRWQSLAAPCGCGCSTPCPLENAVWVIENVEKLTAELQRQFLRDLRIFRNREIRIQEVGTKQGVAAQVPRWQVPERSDS
jgi:hypothetical protein